MKTLLLVDGSSYLYRAFHALPDLRNRLNEPTGAILGVLNMLRRLHKDYAADYSACVFDAKGKTFRDDLYSDYKANRPAMPDDLAVQLEPLCEAIRALGWPLLIVEGVEADDVICTLVSRAAQEGMKCVVSTGDKDIAQLVNSRVILVNTMTNETLDEAGVVKKFGVTPSQLLDYLTLIGDSVDNVPGVEKVGPKTAAKWIAQFGTLDELIAHADEISGVVGENLRKVREWLPHAREVLKVKCDVELPVTFEDLKLQARDIAKLESLFERFEFKSWREELRAEIGRVEPLAAAPHAASEIIFSEAQLNEWLARINDAQLVSIKTETIGATAITAKLVGISVAAAEGASAYLPVAHAYAGAPLQLSCGNVLECMRSWLENPSRKKIGHNLKYDKHVFANHGITLGGIAHDTLLESYVLESQTGNALPELARRHFNVNPISMEDVAGKGAAQIAFDQVAVERAGEYSPLSAELALKLHGELFPKIDQKPGLKFVYEQIEMPLLDVLFAMERNGVLIDVAKLREQSRELAERMHQLQEQAFAEAGVPFNLGSPKQIQEILFDKQKLPVIKKTPSGVPSTDEDVLQKLALDHRLPRILLEHRALSKLKNTYTDKLPQMVDSISGRAHTNYSQAVAVTGRLASLEPNLQNIPIRTAEGRKIREAFIAPPGAQIVSADYSQIELRIMAHLSRDANLLQAFHAGDDIHRATAAEIFGVAPTEVSPEQRRHVKAINFGLIYGMSAFGLSNQLGIERAAAQHYMQRYFARYPGVAQYMERTREKAREQGYVETVFGRRLWLPEITSSNNLRRQAAERAAINAPMQGTAADLIKLAMIAIHRFLHDKQSKLIMQVHDELVLEAPDAESQLIERELPRLMSGVANLDVPLVVALGAGPNWDKAH
ncbi:MAG: DNA polymerase I [Burkholderiales bacterium]